MSNFQFTSAYLDLVHENVLKDKMSEESDLPITKSCRNCMNRCLEPDGDFYCSAVNHPYGRFIRNGPVAECGNDYKLWQIDTRRKGG